MSKIKYVLGFVFALSISGCTDWVEPAIPYSDFQTGVYLRTLSVTTGFDFYNLNAATFQLMIEAVDIEDGGQVREVDVFVAHRRGQTVTPEVKIRNVQASEFQPHSVVLRDVHPASGSKYPAATIQMTMDEAVKALGLTLDDIQAGDFLEFRLVLFTTNGFTFSNNNLSGDVSGGQYYRSPFFYRIPVVCPSELAGTYGYVTTDIVAGPGGNAAACGESVSGTVTLTAVAGAIGIFTISDPSFGVFACAWNDSPPGGTVRFNDTCGTISFTGVDKYGDSYNLTFISNDGEDLVIEWTNSYGDGGTTTIKANPGKPWPPNLM